MIHRIATIVGLAATLLLAGCGDKAAPAAHAEALFAPGSMVKMLPRITLGWSDAAIAEEALTMAKAEGEVPPRLKASLSAAVYRAKVRRERLSDISAWVNRAG